MNIFRNLRRLSQLSCVRTACASKRKQAGKKDHLKRAWTCVPGPFGFLNLNCFISIIIILIIIIIIVIIITIIVIIFIIIIVIIILCLSSPNIPAPALSTLWNCESSPE